jgi:hypothetical protein
MPEAPIMKSGEFANEVLRYDNILSVGTSYKTKLDFFEGFLNGRTIQVILHCLGVTVNL